MEEVEIWNEQGMKVVVLLYGASIKSVFFPDKDGVERDLVLGFDGIAGYESDTCFIGRTVGRVCNRIKHGKFTVNGTDYQLPINKSPHHIHGGSKGLADRQWELIRRSNTSVTLRCVLLDDGYPGEMKVDVCYTVNDLNQLLIEHSAISDMDTIVNITSHSYWNLNGEGKIDDHVLGVNASEYLPTDEMDLPTGEVACLKGTRFDLQTPKKLGDLADANGIISIDNDYVLTGKVADSQNYHSNVTMFSPTTGIGLEMFTSNPIAHVYTGAFLKGKGKNGQLYGPNSGIAIECQGYTDAVNNPHFPSIELKAHTQWFRETVFCLGHYPGTELSEI